MMQNLNSLELENCKAIAEYITDPAQALEKVPRELLVRMLGKQDIREEVAYKILGAHVRLNDEFNEKNPTAIPYETNICDVKRALQENMDMTSFKQLRDCKITINQLKMQQHHKKTGKYYTTVDDIRETVDPQFLVKPRYSGPLYRFLHGQAKSLGRNDANGYNQFMIEAINESERTG